MKKNTDWGKIVAEKDARITALEQRQTELEMLLKFYEQQFKLSKHRQFGKSSEKSDFHQMSFFNEAESESYGKIIKEPLLSEVKPERKKKQKGHKEGITSIFPSETIEYKLTEEEKICPLCGEKLHEMSKEVRKNIEIIPAQVKVTEHVSYTYSCRNCDKNGVSVPVITAPSPKPPIRNSLASPSMLSHIITQKYVLAIPLYRQEQQFQRFGLNLSRQTLSNWVVKAGRLLKPLYDMMHEDLISKDILHADETTLEVLNEPLRETTSDSYMWVYTTGAYEKPIILYEYTPGRSGDYPKEFLKGFKGYLHTDGYAGYHKLSTPIGESPPDVIQVGCFAHARRKYDEALKGLSDKGGNAALLTKTGFEYCNTLFRFERLIKDLPPAGKKKRRDEEAAETLSAYFAWAEKAKEEALPKSLLGSALSYSLKQRKYLENYLLDGRLELSNNRAERAVKPFVIGRKNWLFSNTPAGANAGAVLYSVVETAKENNLNPFEYLKHLFEIIPNIDVNDPAELKKLLPYSGELPQSCENPARSDNGSRP